MEKYGADESPVPYFLYYGFYFLCTRRRWQAIFLSTFFCVFNNFLWVVQNEIDRRVVHQISGNQRKNNRIQENSGRHFSLDCHDFGVEGGKHGGQKNINNSMIYNLREKQINAAC